MAKSIQQQLQEIAKQSMDKVETIVKETYFEVGNDTIIGTPKDSSLLQQSWIAGFERSSFAPKEVGKLTDPSGRLTTALDSGDLIDETFYMVNNQPYAYKIEYEGHSTQKAPQGMLRVSIANFDTIATKMIMKYR